LRDRRRRFFSVGALGFVFVFVFIFVTVAIGVNGAGAATATGVACGVARATVVVGLLTSGTR
jgi:uncharacterized membrane protein